MRLSKMFFKTYRENFTDAEIKSHQLLLRAGYIKKQTAGIYVYLPLGIRSIQKLSNVIREEMDKSGASEVLMSSLLPVDVYESRIKHFGPDMFRLKDRTGKDMCLGPSHEEIFTGVIKDAVKSYKQLPIILYQIQTKFRDEVRPRFGLMRGKEFLMKDAYSYDLDMAGLDASYNLMAKTYSNIFNRLGLDFVAVNADNGTMGGSFSQEFMVKSNVGEDEIIVCDKCDFASNVEKAECVTKIQTLLASPLKLEKIATPKHKTIQELVNYLNLKEENFLKAVVYSTDMGIVVALVRGDREVEEVKLARVLNTIKLELASIDEIDKIGSVAGFVGAMNLKNAYIVADNEVKNMANFVIGANQTDYHYINANIKDLDINVFGDIRKAVSGDICPKCGGNLSIIRGIEVGHIFKLDKRYTKLLDCTYLDEFGKSQYMCMGSYGIGVTRTLSAVIEQFADEDGIILPEEIAPYKLIIVPANMKDENIVNFSDKLYNKLMEQKVEVLIDDRAQSMGAKLKDAELIGIPYIIVVGRDIATNSVELINRKTKEKLIIEFDKIINRFSAK